MTVSCESFDLLAGPSPSRQNQLRTKKEYCFPAFAATLTENIGRFLGVSRQIDIAPQFRVARHSTAAGRLDALLERLSKLDMGGFYLGIIAACSLHR